MNRKDKMIAEPVQNVKGQAQPQGNYLRGGQVPQDYYQQEEESQQEGEEVLPTNIKPLKLLVKFEPPLIGLLYTDLDDNEKMHIYNVLLNGIINLGDPEEITKHLFLDHAMFFNEKFVNFKQVEGLVAKILEYFIQLAHLDEQELAQYYAMNKQGEDYLGDEEDMEAGNFENISPVKVNKGKPKGQKMGEEYAIDNLDIRQYQNFNAGPPNAGGGGKKGKVKAETHSD